MSITARLQKSVIDAILEIVPIGGTILEFGSGYSTRCFARAGRKVFSIESDSRWAIEHENVTTILIPIVGRWYDIEMVRQSIAGLNYDLILIDGPKGYGRTDRLRVLSVADLLHDVPIVVDDIHRPKEKQIADSIKGNKRTIGRACFCEPP